MNVIPCHAFHLFHPALVTLPLFVHPKTPICIGNCVVPEVLYLPVSTECLHSRGHFSPSVVSHIHGITEEHLTTGEPSDTIPYSVGGLKRDASYCRADGQDAEPQLKRLFDLLNVNYYWFEEAQERRNVCRISAEDDRRPAAGR